MKIVWDENQHNDFEKDFVVVHCWKEEFDIQDLILICFEFRTLFDLRNKETSTIKRCFRYLNKTVKIKFELRISLRLCFLKRNMISKLSRRFYIFEKEQNLEIYQNVIVFFEKSIVNENWFQKMLAIELIIVKMMILKQFKKRKTFFRKRKFDILIRFI
jgi:hypothetical protein